MFADAKKVIAAGVAQGGSGFAPGQVLTLCGGIPLYCEAPNPARVMVGAVDGTGMVTQAALVHPGAYHTPPPAPYSVRGGTGTGFVPNLTFGLLWQNADWVVLDPAIDLQRVMDKQQIEKFNENIAATAAPSGQPTDPGTLSRVTSVMGSYVDMVLAAVRKGNKVPLSLTVAEADTLAAVPPEAVLHVLNMTAWQIICSTPNLSWAIQTEKGVYAPMKSLADAGRQWCEAVEKGKLVTYPSDPDPTWQPPYGSGAGTGDADLQDFGGAHYMGGNNPQLGAL